MEGTEFVRLGKTLADTELSRKYPDLYNSAADTYHIKGAQDTKSILSTFRIPDSPPFGSSELKSLEYYFYTHSITIGNSLRPIRLAAYKFKNEDDASFDSSKLTDNTGLVMGTTPVIENEPLFFAATSSSKILDGYSENFTGLDNELIGDSAYVSMGRKSYVLLSPYVEPYDFMGLGTRDHGTLARRGGDKSLAAHYTMDKLKKYHGIILERGPEGINERVIIPIVSHDSENWRTKINKDDEEWKYFPKVYMFGGTDLSLNAIRSSELLESDDHLYGDEVTPSNSIFSFVRGSLEVYETDNQVDPDSTAAAPQLAMSAMVKFTSDDASTGQCAQFFVYHQDNVSYDTFGPLGDSVNAMNKASTENGSDAVAVIRSVPAPYNIGVPIPGVLPHVSESGYRGTNLEAKIDPDDMRQGTGAMMAPGVIQIDFTISEMETAYASGTSSANYSATARSFTIMMSDLAPEPAVQRFRDYLDEVTGKNSGSTDAWAHNGVGITFLKDKNGNIRMFGHDDFTINNYYATTETNSFEATGGSTPGTVNIDGTAVTITASQSAAAVAAIVAAASYTNYTAAVTSTNKVTFTQKASGADGIAGITMSDANYVSSDGSATITAADFALASGALDGVPTGWGHDYYFPDSVTDHVLPIPEATSLRLIIMENDVLDGAEWGIFLYQHEEGITGAGDYNLIGYNRIKAHHGSVSATAAAQVGIADGGLSFGTGKMDATITGTQNNNSMRHMSFWLTNHINQKSGTNDGNIDINSDCRTIVNIDSINFYGYNNTLTNATILSSTGEGKYISPHFNRSPATLPYKPLAYYSMFMGKDLTGNDTNWLPYNAGVLPTTLNRMVHGVETAYGSYVASAGTTASTSRAYNYNPIGPGSTVFCWGFDALDDFDANTYGSEDRFIFLQDFLCTQLKLNNQIDESLMMGGYTIDMESTVDDRVPLGCQNHPVSISPRISRNVLLVGKDAVGLAGSTADDILIDPTLGASGFTEKGFIQLKFNSSLKGPRFNSADPKVQAYTRTAPAKRECVYASARILRAKKEGASVVIQTDCLEPFACKPSQEYIVYLMGADAQDDYNYAKGIKITSADKIGNKMAVTLDWDGKNEDGALSLIEDHLIPHLWICPLAYWMWIYIPNYKDSSGGADLAWDGTGSYPFHSTYNKLDSLLALPSKSYGSCLVTSSIGTPGATFNEWMFSNSDSSGGGYVTTITGLNEAAWDLSLTTEEGMFDLQDFGFGGYEEDEEGDTGFKGGHVGLGAPKKSAYSKIRMPAIIEAGDLKPTDFVALYISLKNTSIDHSIEVKTRNNSTVDFVDPVSKEPIIAARYFDALPQPLTDFKIKPYEKDAYIQEYTWSVSDEDLWYGIMHVDSDPIYHQYHKAILHLPLNESSTAEGIIYRDDPAKLLKVFNYENGEKSHQKMGSVSGAGLAGYSENAFVSDKQFLTDPQGLAGNTCIFGGSRYQSDSQLYGGKGTLFSRGVIVHPLGTDALTTHGGITSLSAGFTPTAPTDEFSLSMHITPDGKPPAPYTLKANNIAATFSLNETNRWFGGGSTAGGVDKIREALDVTETEIDVYRTNVYAPQFAIGNKDGSNAFRTEYGTDWVTTGEDPSTGNNYDIDDSILLKCEDEIMKITGVNPGTLTQIAKNSSCTIDVSDNQIDLANHGFVVGTPVKFTGITNATGISNNVTYYVAAFGELIMGDADNRTFETGADVDWVVLDSTGSDVTISIDSAVANKLQISTTTDAELEGAQLPIIHVGDGSTTSVVAGKTYRVSMKVRTITGSNLNVKFGIGGALSDLQAITTSETTFTKDIVATNNTGALLITASTSASAAYVFTIDDVSVTEIITPSLNATNAFRLSTSENGFGFITLGGTDDSSGVIVKAALTLDNSYYSSENEHSLSTSTTAIKTNILAASGNLIGLAGGNAVRNRDFLTSANVDWVVLDTTGSDVTISIDTAVADKLQVTTTTDNEIEGTQLPIIHVGDGSTTSVIVGNTYKVKMKLAAAAGTPAMRIGLGGALSSSFNISTTETFYTQDIVATNTTGALLVYNTSATALVFTVDDASVREVTTPSLDAGDRVVLFGASTDGFATEVMVLGHSDSGLHETGWAGTAGSGDGTRHFIKAEHTDYTFDLDCAFVASDPTVTHSADSRVVLGIPMKDETSGDNNVPVGAYVGLINSTTSFEMYVSGSPVNPDGGAPSTELVTFNFSNIGRKTDLGTTAHATCLMHMELNTGAPATDGEVMLSNAGNTAEPVLENVTKIFIKETDENGRSIIGDDSVTGVPNCLGTFSASTPTEILIELASDTTKFVWFKATGAADTSNSNYQIIPVLYHGGATGNTVNTFTDEADILWSKKVNPLTSSGPCFLATGDTYSQANRIYGEIGGGSIKSSSTDGYYVDKLGFWKLTGRTITVERGFGGTTAVVHAEGTPIYAISDSSPAVGGITISDIDDVDDSTTLPTVYDSVNDDQLWRFSFLQIGDEKMVTGDMDVDSTWASSGWVRNIENTDWEVHDADSVTVLPRHYIFHSFTGNSTFTAGVNPTAPSAAPVVSVYMDSDGKINVTAYIENQSYKYPLTLKSKTVIPFDGLTPTHVGVVFDSQIASQNLKLFLNGKLEDATGYRATTGTVNNLQNNADGTGGEPLKATMGTVCIGGMPHQTTSSSTTYGTNGFDGAIEDVCIWNRAVYFVEPSVGTYKHSKPYKELESGQSKAMSHTIFSKLFIKDYHNIRGKSGKEVRSSAMVSVRKAAFTLDTT